MAKRFSALESVGGGGHQVHTAAADGQLAELELLPGAPLVVFRWALGPDRPILAVTSNVHNLLGVAPGELTGHTTPYLEFVHPDDRPDFEDAADGSALPDDGEPDEYRVVGADGATRWVEERVVPLRDDHGQRTGSIGYVVDVTRRKQRELDLSERLLRLEVARRQARLSYWRRPLDAGGLSHFYDQGGPILGLSDDALPLTDEKMLALVHPEDRGRVAAVYHSAVTEGGGFEIEFRVVRPDGEVRYLVERAEVERNALGQPIALHGILQDVTGQVLREAELWDRATHDELTGLANRSLFMDRLGLALASAQRSGRAVAVLFIDFDDFKAVNDSAGHAAGDACLREVARRLSGYIRASDVACRLGGDEFTVALTGVRDAADALRVAEKMRAELSRDYVVDGTRAQMSCSIGIAMHPEHGTTAEALLHSADVAMYRVKRDGKNSVRLMAEPAGDETQRMVAVRTSRKNRSNSRGTPESS